MDRRILKQSTSKIEIVRALDIFSILVNDSHYSKRLSNIRTDINDNNGRVIFFTRLWSPNNAKSPLEKQRRVMQNEFRINACRIIKSNFKNSMVGIQEDAFSRTMAPDLLLKRIVTKKSNFISQLKGADIGIADDGLFDTVGWKIGEYIMGCKAVISTPINVHISNFYENKNYLSPSTRDSYSELPVLIEHLLEDKRYMQLKKENKDYYFKYLDPSTYINNILNRIT